MNGRERNVFVFRGIFGFLSIVFRLLWKAFVWTLAGDRWQVSVGLLFLSIVGCGLSVFLYRFIKPMGEIARWKTIGLIGIAVALFALGVAFLYSYAVDRSKQTWIETRTAEGDWTLERIKLAFGQVGESITSAITERAHAIRDMESSDFMGAHESRGGPGWTDDVGLQIIKEVDDAI